MRLKILIPLILTIIIVICLSRIPDDKQQFEIWRVECELGVVTDPDCPVDGGWSPWGVWSACRGPCDQVGHRVRTRECTNPPPSPGGKICSGSQEQTENCHITNCSVSNFRSLVEGDRSRSEALRQLEAVPALMERCLHMDCAFEAIEGALAVDNTWQLNAESIWNSLLCVKHNIGCPVTGEWGAWGKWSTCSARCGKGFKWRFRRCNAPSPSEARYVCSGSPVDAKPCEGDQCAIEQRGASGTWAEWGEWSACSESCGAGIQRRRRNCVETQTPLVSGVWGTHCRGQHEQIQQCNNEQCTLNGGWSGWGPWGPCSQTCGAGRRTRSRSCTRPIPSGSGRPCTGPKTEVGSCYLVPCNVNSHKVALFNGDSYLQYRFEKQKNVMFHFYVRFMPLSPQGTLVRRGPTYSPYVQLMLHKGHICLDAGGLDRSCSLPRICSRNAVKQAVWHTVMVTVTTESAALRLDDAPIALKNVFPCDPDLPKNEEDLIVGNKFYGEIQEVIINFVPFQITLEKGKRSVKSDQFPVIAKNIAYEMGNLEEGYVYLNNEYFMRLPCFNEGEEWELDLTLKPKRDSGTVLFIGNVHEWLHVTLQNSRLKLKLVYGGYRSESLSASEFPNDQWLDITIKKTQLVNSIEAIVNGRERLHVQVESEIERKRREFQKLFRNINLFKAPESKSPMKLCGEEYFVGGMPPNLKSAIREEFTSFQGYVATIRLNGVLYDLHGLGMERYKNNLLQLSSRTASVSDHYQEITWGKSNSLNLSCLHPRMARSSSDSHWLYLDSEINEHRVKMDRGRANGRVLRLTSTPVHDIRGFYTCRAYTDKYTRNILTFAVLGKATYKSSDPYLPTLIAVLSSLFLIVTCLGWLFGEGINDIRKGHGFFRDRHMTHGQIVKAICEYIDANQDSIGGSEGARMSRLIARRRALNALFRATFDGPTHRRKIMQQPRRVNENIPHQVDMPALLEKTSGPADVSHDIVRFEPNNVSTPQHGSLSSPKRKLTSLSSVAVLSPRVLCSRIAVAKNRMSPRSSVASRKSITRKNRSNWANKAAQTILHKFQQLRNDL